MNKLVKGNLVRGLPSKIFENDHTCVACQKEKQHKATCKAKQVSSISQPLQMLHMDLFGPTFVMSINHKKYCLVVTDDFSRFGWVFSWLLSLKLVRSLNHYNYHRNQINKKVKVIRCDNETEFKNKDLDEFYGMKGVKREYSNARTPLQNKVAERKNRTLIKAARTMLVDSLLPITFWAEAVNTACYVLNRALVTKHHNKTLYELLNGRSPRLDSMRPFGYFITILNTLDPLGNKTDKNAGLQDTDDNAGTQDNVDTGKEVSDQHYIVLPLWSSISSNYKSSDDKAEDDKPKDDIEKEASDATDFLSKEFEQGYMDQRAVAKAGSTNSFFIVSNPINAASTSGTFSDAGPSSPHLDAFIPDNMLLHVDQDDSQIPNLEDTAKLRSTSIFTSAYDDDLDTFTSPI
nr:putative ribonuclease H-like domain-containing protein [Tanacetum cinerariifolium]